jgi:hypothetical protein
MRFFEFGFMKRRDSILRVGGESPRNGDDLVNGGLCRPDIGTKLIFSSHLQWLPPLFAPIDLNINIDSQ